MSNHPQIFLLKREEEEKVKVIMDILGIRSKSDYFRLCILNPPLEIFSLDKYKQGNIKH